MRHCSRRDGANSIDALRMLLASSYSGEAGAQPELLAHHYTEAGLTAEAVPTGCGLVR